MVHEAIKYLNAGYAVIPIIPNQKHPPVSWREFQSRKPTVEEINTWWNKWPNANVGLITGKINGITVVDVDKEGLPLLNKLKLPITRVAKTGGGGFHYYYEYTDHVHTQSGIYPGIDIRNNGGLVVAPPSVHPSGNLYEWSVEEPIAPFPTDKFPKTEKKTGEWKGLIKRGAENGNRNSAATSLIGGLLHIFPEDSWEDIWSFIMWWNQTKNNPPLPVDELKRTFKSIARYAHNDNERDKELFNT